MADVASPKSVISPVVVSVIYSKVFTNAGIVQPITKTPRVALPTPDPRCDSVLNSPKLRDSLLFANPLIVIFLLCDGESCPVPSPPAK